jgi:hypothetical protein
MSYGQLEIHEFSTGITPDGTRDSWVSKGFTGGYMNCTGEIPHAVKRAIANQWFEVSPNPDINDPAIIGFVVDEWAVVAVVIQARDDTSRSFSAYRYFWAEGKEESLSKIVAWLNNEISRDRMPVFNPFENRTSPNLSEVPPADFDEVRVTELVTANTSTPLIFDPSSDNLLSYIDCIACKKAEVSGQPTSWAYNVRALERPEVFQVILPTNNQALELIKKTIATRPKQVVSMTIDEQALKTAIKGLVDRATIKPEQWLIFIQNLALVDETFADKNKSTNYWNKLFDGQGATNAIKDKIYTEQMVRLLTLRAIALPETLPDLLKWLKIGAKNSEYGNLSLEFQGQIRNLLYEDDLKAQIMVGGRNLIEEVLTEDITVKATAIFLSDVKSIWAKYRLEYAKDLKNDLEILGEEQTTYRKQGQTQTTFNYNFSKGMQRYWQPYRIKPNTDYAVLAELFIDLKDYQLAACFHQLSKGYVPDNLFTAAFPGYKGSKNFHGLRIRQEGYDYRGEKIIVPRLYVVAIALTTFLVGFGGGFFIKGLPPFTPSNKSSNSSPTTIPFDNTNGSPASTIESKKPSPKANTNKLNPNSEIPQDTLEKALQAYGKPSKTKQSLEKIFSEIKVQEDCDISPLLNTALMLNSSPLGKITYKKNNISILEENQTILVKGIYKFQDKNKDGVVDSGGETYNKLKNALQKE